MNKAKTVEEYLSQVTQPIRAAIDDLRAAIRSVVPDATEQISYGIPMFKHKGHLLVGYGAFKDHCSFFGASSTVLDNFVEDIKRYKSGKGTVHFTPDNPLPKELVVRLVEARIRENDVKDRQRAIKRAKND